MAKTIQVEGYSQASSGVRNYQVKFLVGGVIILAAVGYLIVTGLGGMTMYTLKVDELYTKIPDIYDTDVRVSGLVVPGSVNYDAQSLRLDFEIVSQLEQQDKPLRVVYYGPKPDGLQEEGEAIIEGQLRSDGVFYAHERDDALKSKCASKYEEAP